MDQVRSEDDTAWADRSAYWQRQATWKPRRPHEKRKVRSLVLGGHGVRLRIDGGSLFVQNGFTHYPQKREEWRFFPGHPDLTSRIVVVDGSGAVTFHVLAWLATQQIPLIQPTFPGFWVVGGQDRPVGPPCNGKSRCARAGGVENRGLTCSEARKPTAPPASRRTSPLVAVASDPRPSCWRGRRPQPGDQTENVVEHLSRHRNLGHLKRDVAAVADHLGGDLDQLFPQAGQRPWLRRLGHRQRSHEIAEIVGQGMELKANRVGSERTA